MESQDYSYHNQDEPVVGPVRVLGHDASDAHHVSGTSISRGRQGEGQVPEGSSTMALPSGFTPHLTGGRGDHALIDE